MSGMVEWGYRIIAALLCLFLSPGSVNAQYAMVNIQGRNTVSLNGLWNVLIDPADVGDWRKVWLEEKPRKRTDFFEYGFEGGPSLQVPGDFNTQMPELTWFEGTIWYKKQFHCSLQKGKRLFLHFGAVNYSADVYINGEKAGSHEGGFTPFQFDITGNVKDGLNTLIVKVNNSRKKDGLPGPGFDWLNYGGITRDVDIVETTDTYIEDYSIQLKKGSLNTVEGYVQLNGTQKEQEVIVTVPSLHISFRTKTDKSGFAPVTFSASFKLWSPENPVRYEVVIQSATDTIAELIGFRNIGVKGDQVLLNGKPLFMKSVNIHEENPQKGARAFSRKDAAFLLSAAKELGCNMVRMVHYPHNEYMVREAERIGLMVWSELPIYQHIAFADSSVPVKMERMLREMIRRDKNRCAVVVWGLSNETYPSSEDRTEALAGLTKKCRALDSTRLVTHVMNTHQYKNNTFILGDSLHLYSDIISINEYVGWYTPWQGNPSHTKWQFAYPGKPVFVSEFGGEALYGNRSVGGEEATPWTEEYQAEVYSDQLRMFQTVPGLCGVCPWLLFDYRSPGRMHPVYQKGYNRKGLLSEKGDKKKAWYTMKTYFEKR